MVRKAFGGDNISVFNDSAALFSALNELRAVKPVYLFMSSGDFDGYDIKSVIQ